MYNVNLLPGKNTFIFSERIFNDFNYESTENFDFDLFVTDGFHLVQSGRSEPILNYEDLKTDKLIIFNYDKCSPLEQELFTSVRKFLNGKSIKCLVITLQHIVNDEDLPKDFDYLSFDFHLFEAVDEYLSGNRGEFLKLDNIFDIWKNTIHYLKPKKFLSFNNAPHSHRIKLKDFLVKRGYIDDGWFSFDPYSEDGINLDCMPNFTALSRFDKFNLGLYLTSYFSIFGETIFDGDDIPSIKFTTKVWMSMTILHPFFLLGQAKTLSYLRSVGFKTFEDFWDESYDDEFDNEIRFKKFCKAIEDLLIISNYDIHRKLFGKKYESGEVDNPEWMKMYKILKHNYLHLPVHAKNQKQKVIDKITNFVKE